MISLKFVFSLAIISAAVSCQNNSQQTTTVTTKDTIAIDSFAYDSINPASVHADDYNYDNDIEDEKIPPPVIYSSGARDTIITFDIEELSSEGSEAEVRYINDTIMEVNWTLFGAGGRSHIKYTYQKDGAVIAFVKNYTYKVALADVKSDKDMVLTSKYSYVINPEGVVETPPKHKDYQDLYPTFKIHVPLFLTRKSEEAQHEDQHR